MPTATDKPKTKRQRRKPAPVVTRQIAHKGLWQAAMKIAEGDMSRIVVESPTRLTVNLP